MALFVTDFVAVFVAVFVVVWGAVATELLVMPTIVGHPPCGELVQEPCVFAVRNGGPPCGPAVHNDTPLWTSPAHRRR